MFIYIFMTIPGVENRGEGVGVSDPSFSSKRGLTLNNLDAKHNMCAGR